MSAITFIFVLIEIVVFGIFGFIFGGLLYLLYRVVKMTLRMLWRGTRRLRGAAP
jgi:hypothetical protein